MTQTNTSPTKKLIIVGGGFAGVALARQLGKDRRYTIQLLSDSDHFTYYPQLYSSATGYTGIKSSIPLDLLLYDRPRVEVIKAKATAINTAAHQLTTEDGTVYEYDTAVLALGMVTSYFNIPGLQENCYGIKTMDGIARFRQHAHELVTTSDKPEAANYVVVGGGPTGVELAAMLGEYLHHIGERHGKEAHPSVKLVDSSPRVLPRMSERSSRAVTRRLQRLGVELIPSKVVQSQTPDSVTIGDQTIATETVVWTAGMSNNPFYAANAGRFTFNDRNKVVVDEHMMAAPDVYVLGDNAAMPSSGLAETAVSDGRFLAANLKRLANGQSLKSRHQHQPINVVPVGDGWAVLEYGKLVVTGWLAWMVRRAADLIGYYDIAPWPIALAVWMADHKTDPDCLRCRSNG